MMGSEESSHNGLLLTTKLLIKSLDLLMAQNRPLNPPSRTAVSKCPPLSEADGEGMIALTRDLFPIFRSVTGNGVGANARDPSGATCLSKSMRVLRSWIGQSALWNRVPALPNGEYAEYHTSVATALRDYARHSRPQVWK
jgi:hypothetical protein